MKIQNLPSYWYWAIKSIGTLELRVSLNDFLRGKLASECCSILSPRVLLPLASGRCRASRRVRGAVRLLVLRSTALPTIDAWKQKYELHEKIMNFMKKSFQKITKICYTSIFCAKGLCPSNLKNKLRAMAPGERLCKLDTNYKQYELLFEFQISKPEATSTEGKLLGSPKNICNASYLLAEKKLLDNKTIT